MSSPTYFRPDGGRPKFVTHLFFPTTASAIVTRASTSLGAFSTVAAFPAPTVSILGSGFTVPATDFDGPKIQITNAPPGIYKVTMQFPAIGASAANANFAIADNTVTTAGLIQVDLNGTTFQPINLVACFKYTTAGTRTFEPFASTSASVTVSLRNDQSTAGDTTQTIFTVEFYPL